MTNPTVGLIGTAAGGVESLRARLIEPALSRGWRVAVTLTPTAASWLQASDEIGKIEAVTDLPVRVKPRLPGETSPHPAVHCYAIVPASANTVAKFALGLADNQALTTACEALGGREVPIVVFPRINAAHARQPAWSSHIEALRRSGVHLVYGDDVWPLHEPRSAPGRDLPWGPIMDTIEATLLGRQHR